MRNKLLIFFAVQIFLNTQLTISLYGQLNIRADAETGVYGNTGSEILDRYDYFNSLEGQIGYGYKDESRSANVKLRIRPEFYGIKNQLKTLKIRADAAYHQNEKTFNWGFRVNRQQYKFDGRNIDLNYDSFNLVLKGDLFFIDNLPLSIAAGYGYQKINNDGSQDLDLYMLDLYTTKNLGRFSYLSAGLYIEKFNVSGNNYIAYYKSPEKNDGWRFGPQLIFNYIKDLVINFEYRFLFHNSDLTRNVSYEQMLRFVAGKLFTEKLSGFILADLYFRNFRLNSIGETNLYLLYNSMNIDNRIYLKVGYDLSGLLEVYIRTGYSKENLIDNKYSFSGWNAVFGIEIGSENF